MRLFYSTLALAFLSQVARGAVERQQASDARVLPDGQNNGCKTQQPVCHRLPWAVDQYSLGALASHTIHDKSGNKVGHLEDVTISAGGCVVSATVALNDGARITVPFHKLKMAKKEDGSLEIQTDVLVKPDAAPGNSGTACKEAQKT